MLDVDRGWIEVAEVLNLSEVETIVAAAEDWLEGLVYGGDRRTELHVGDKPAGGTRRLAVMNERVDLVADLLSRTPLLAAVAQLAADGLELLDPNETANLIDVVDVAYRGPTPGYGAQRLHTDAVARVSPAAIEAPPEVVVAIVALVDFTEENGATRVVPGSHRRIDLQREAPPEHPEECTLIGPAGTAFVFSGHVLHAGGANRSDHARHAVQIVWRR